MKFVKFTIISLSILAIMAACGSTPTEEAGTEQATSTQPAPTLDATAMNEAIAATVSAELTKVAAENPTTTEVPPTETTDSEPTAAPTDVPFPTATISDLALDNQALFLEDVTIPDGTEIIGGEEFVKTWRVQNIGLNAWTTEYTFVFVNGERMEGFPIAFEADVLPGSIVDISIPMVAPLEGGSYEGYWMFSTDEDFIFGFGEDANLAVTVSIVVIEPTPEPTPTETPAP